MESAQPWGAGAFGATTLIPRLYYLPDTLHHTSSAVIVRVGHQIVGELGIRAKLLALLLALKPLPPFPMRKLEDKLCEGT